MGSRNLLMLQRAEKGLIPLPFAKATPRIPISHEIAEEAKQDHFLSSSKSPPRTTSAISIIDYETKEKENQDNLLSPSKPTSNLPPTITKEKQDNLLSPSKPTSNLPSITKEKQDNLLSPSKPISNLPSITIFDITGIKSFADLLNDFSETSKNSSNFAEIMTQDESYDTDATYCEDTVDVDITLLRTTRSSTPVARHSRSPYIDDLELTNNLEMCAENSYIDDPLTPSLLANTENQNNLIPCVDTVNVQVQVNSACKRNSLKCRIPITNSIINRVVSSENAHNILTIADVGLSEVNTPHTSSKTDEDNFVDDNLKLIREGEEKMSQCDEIVEEVQVNSGRKKYSLKCSIPISGPVHKNLVPLVNIQNNQSLADMDLTEVNTSTLQDISETDKDPFSGTDSEDEFKPEKKKRRRRLSSTSSSTSSSSSSSTSSSGSSSSSTSSTSSSSPNSPKKGKKRKQKPHLWKKEVTKRLKNSGKAYVSSTGKVYEAKTMKPPCKCRLGCNSKFNDEMRKEIFDKYWALSSLERQRCFLSSCTTVLNVNIRRIRATASKPRNPNCAFYFTKNGQNVRICKTFFLNTLGIAQRTLRTVIEAKTNDIGIVPSDKRGKHPSHCKVDSEVYESVRDHINSIPRIESHYMRANTSREFIDGGLSIAEMHRNYKQQREALNKVAAKYDFYARIFNTEFNISFFVPKKDQCDQCESFRNATGEEKIELEENYNIHQKQKQLSRKEKKNDIADCKKTETNTVVAIYDLQAVMPVPLGESSAFFYKSKINCYNFTVSDLHQESTDCYFWHEGLGNRGANEIGSCVFDYMKNIEQSNPNCDLIFYSDNCCVQQKNRFIFSMYFYAVMTLAIKSVTHKFLIRGHTQNEGDSAHSLIEKSIKKAKKSGPIYVPEQYVQIIRGAKKTGKPFKVHELNFDDFIDLKKVTDDLGINFVKDVNGQQVKLSEIKMIRFVKDRDTYSVKYAYDSDWTEVSVKNKPGRASRKQETSENVKNISFKPAYTSRICITGRKKDDILYLMRHNIVPKHYAHFYNSIF